VAAVAARRWRLAVYGGGEAVAASRYCDSSKHYPRCHWNREFVNSGLSTFDKIGLKNQGSVSCVIALKTLLWRGFLLFMAAADGPA